MKRSKICYPQICYIFARFCKFAKAFWGEYGEKISNTFVAKLNTIIEKILKIWSKK
jgi:hypothetical protein